MFEVNMVDGLDIVYAVENKEGIKGKVFYMTDLDNATRINLDVHTERLTFVDGGYTISGIEDIKEAVNVGTF